MNKTLNSRNNTSLATWHQGALFTKVADTEGDKQLMCPHCGQKGHYAPLDVALQGDD